MYVCVCVGVLSNSYLHSFTSLHTGSSYSGVVDNLPQHNVNILLRSDKSLNNCGSSQGKYWILSTRYLSLQPHARVTALKISLRKCNHSVGSTKSGFPPMMTIYMLMV